ncbi:retrotransposon ORF1 [Tanacetum coccineum]
MERSKGVFRMTSNEMYQIPPEPSRQEEFEHIVINFILDQEERVKQLEEYIRVIVDDFMQLSLKVTRRLKEKIIEEESRIRKIEKITKYPYIKANLFRVNEPIYRELVREFFTSFEFKASACRYDPEHLGVKFRLGGEQREMSLLELGWRVGLYSERKSRENATLSGLSRAETVKATRLLMKFWPSIGGGGFNVGNIKVESIRNPRVKLAHRCIATTISGRKESTNRVT